MSHSAGMEPRRLASEMLNCRMPRNVASSTCVLHFAASKTRARAVWHVCLVALPDTGASVMTSSPVVSGSTPPEKQCRELITDQGRRVYSPLQDIIFTTLPTACSKSRLPLQKQVQPRSVGGGPPWYKGVISTACKNAVKKAVWQDAKQP